MSVPAWDEESLRGLPTPFYRVTAKALIFDENQRLLIVKNHKGFYEIPGGGWEHDESFVDCLARELQEELGVEPVYISSPVVMWTHQNPRREYRALRIGAVVRVNSLSFMPGDGMTEGIFVTQTEFAALDMKTYEGEVQAFTDTIWSEQVLAYAKQI